MGEVKCTRLRDIYYIGLSNSYVLSFKFSWKILIFTSWFDERDLLNDIRKIKYKFVFFRCCL